MSLCANVTVMSDFQHIQADFFCSEMLHKGEDLAQYVYNVAETRATGTVKISAKCIRTTSLSEEPYNVELDIDPTSRHVISAYCTCVADVIGACKHATASYIVVNRERTESCTDLTKRWKAPSSKLLALYRKGIL